MEYIHLQLSSFLVLLFTGMVLGGFFDLYRVFRSQIKVTKLINYLGDCFFWFLAALLIIPLIYWGTWLEIRLYVWVAILIGFILYFTFLSSFFIPLFKIFWQVVSWLPRMVLNVSWKCRILVKKINWLIQTKKKEAKLPPSNKNS